MPYVNSDGTVSTSPPLVKRVTNAFWGFVDFMVIFFRTLIPGMSERGSQFVSNFRNSGSGGPPRPPQRRMGGFKTLSDCRAPMPGGG